MLNLLSRVGKCGYVIGQMRNMVMKNTNQKVRQENLDKPRGWIVYSLTILLGLLIYLTIFLVVSRHKSATVTQEVNQPQPSTKTVKISSVMNDQEISVSKTNEIVPEGYKRISFAVSGAEFSTKPSTNQNPVNKTQSIR